LGEFAPVNYATFTGELAPENYATSMELFCPLLALDCFGKGLSVD